MCCCDWKRNFSECQMSNVAQVFAQLAQELAQSRRSLITQLDFAGETAREAKSDTTRTRLAVLKTNFAFFNSEVETRSQMLGERANEAERRLADAGSRTMHLERQIAALRRRGDNHVNSSVRFDCCTDHCLAVLDLGDIPDKGLDRSAIKLELVTKSQKWTLLDSIAQQ